jgi:CheY-like chemotaxis protein
MAMDIAQDIPGELIGDPHRLRQVLLNLIGNAVKFTDRGEVVVTVSEEPDGDDEHAKLLFQVRDTGIGIPKDKHDEIFQAFTQADASSTRRFGGTGLGLAISTQLVQQMGGTLSVESEPGKGSTFSFTATFKKKNRIDAHSIPTAGLQGAPGKASRSFRLLLAEDNPINQRVARGLLEKAGHSVTTVEEGGQAVEEVKNNPYDIVLMDLQMPNIDGFEATRRIRALDQAELAWIPIIALTAHAMQGDRERCLEGGMDGYVMKPIQPEHLYAEMARVTGEPSTPVVVRKASAGGDSILDRDDLMARLQGDTGILSEVVHIFAQELPNHLAALHAALDAGDANRIREVAHKLKGSVGNLGSKPAYRVASALEKAGASGDLSGSAETFEELSSLTKQLLDELTNMITSVSSHPTNRR